MPHFRELVYTGTAGGLDYEQSLLVMNTSSIKKLLLVAGNGVTAVEIDPKEPEIAEIQLGGADPSLNKNELLLTGWEKQNQLQILTVKTKNKTGKGLIKTYDAEKKYLTKPLELRVIQDPDWRQCGERSHNPEFAEELKGMSLRNAVIRIAEDQMNSRIGRTGHAGFGRYTDYKIGKDKDGRDSLNKKDGSPVNYCGAFAFWCWKRAFELTGNPALFGVDENIWLSPIKTISWALRNPLKTDLINCEDGDYGLSNQNDEQSKPNASAFIRADANNVDIGDICLIRGEDGNWKHVCMVYKPPEGGTFTTIDGNAEDVKSHNNFGGCVSINSGKNITDKVRGKYKYAFLHLRVPKRQRLRPIYATF